VRRWRPAVLSSDAPESAFTFLNQPPDTHYKPARLQVADIKTFGNFP